MLRTTLDSDKDADFRRAPRGDWTPTNQEGTELSGAETPPSKCPG